MNNFQVTDANHDLEKEEVDIVTGALKYKEKSIKQIMTRIEDVYMLQLTSVLNFETVSEIRDQGYSRIPVYDKSRTDIVHILFAKVSLNLNFVDLNFKSSQLKFWQFRGIYSNSRTQFNCNWVKASYFVIKKYFILPSAGGSYQATAAAVLSLLLATAFIARKHWH